VVIDRESMRSRGFGFVAFAQEQSMFTAIERMNGRELGGRQITVNQAGAVENTHEIKAFARRCVLTSHVVAFFRGSVMLRSRFEAGY
jgi:RNA recognition motif-containing protein